MGDELNTYSWETDEGWIAVEKRLDFPAGLSNFKKRKAIEKRKIKYYKRHVNPEYTPPGKVPLLSKADPSKADPTKPAEKKENEKKEEPEEVERERPPEKTKEPSQDEDSNEPNSDFANGTFVKLQLKNAKYNGLVGEVVKFLPDANRYLVRLHLPETTKVRAGMYKSEIKVPAASISKTSKMPVYGEMLLHCVVLACAVVTFFSKRFYSYSLFATMILSILGLTYLKGKPSANAEYAQNALQCPQAMNLMCAVALFMAKPYIFFLAPTICRSVNRGFGLLANTMAKDSPSLYAKLKPLIDPVLDRRTNFEQTGLTMEVYLGFGQIIGLVLGMSSFGSIFIYWNFLRMKYMFSTELKQIFAQVKLSVDQKLYSYPSVKGYWQKACDFAHSYVDENQLRQQYNQAQAGGGMMSKLKNMCTIM